MKILIVDDSLFAQQYTKKQVQQRYPQAEYVLASSGEAAYGAFISEKPDVVITDLLMPGITGQQLISMIRETDAACKIVVLSCDIQKAVREEIAELDVQCFINKPLKDDNISMLQEAIGKG